MALFAIFSVIIYFYLDNRPVLTSYKQDLTWRMDFIKKKVNYKAESRLASILGENDNKVNWIFSRDMLNAYKKHAENILSI